MKVLVIGSGAREHALGEKAAGPDRQLYFIPGNAGTGRIGKNVDLEIKDHKAIVDFAKKEGIDFTLVGPEAPLVEGLVDALEENGLKAFGPKKREAQLEGSKTYAKDFCLRHGLLTAKAYPCQNPEEIKSHALDLIEKDGTAVLKADGLAAGKGVILARSEEEVDDFIDKLSQGAFGEKKALVEEFISGFEVSVHALVAGDHYALLPTARDHKKAYDGELGPNTGGMGTYSPNIQADVYTKEIREKILDPFMAGLKKDGLDYHGVIFIGCMISSKGIYVLEFNVRFGDPETQSILNRLDEDFLDLCHATRDGSLKEDVKIKDNKVLTLTIASKGYPGTYEKGYPISLEGLDQVKIYHGGTKEEDGKLLSNGGRVLSITGEGASFKEARDKVYQAAEKLDFDNKFYRTDIGPSVKRAYVAKKDAYQVEAKKLSKDLEEVLGHSVQVKIYARYDIEGLEDQDFDQVCHSILAEAPVDDLFIEENALDLQKDFANSLVVEYHKGQFDQRKQGLLDTIMVLLGRDDVLARTARVYDFQGLKEGDLEKIRDYLINPVDEKEGQVLGIPTTLRETFSLKITNPVYQGFRNLTEEGLEDFIKDQGLAMNLDDLRLVQDYFKEKDRDPNETEIGLLDTYWSDHCRHTTFNTILEIEDFVAQSKLDETIQETLDNYLNLKKTMKKQKPISLMDLGTIVAKSLRERGLADRVEVSDEINACSVFVDCKIQVEGEEKTVPYLLMFKNETHNHPAGVEPFGGAATCLGGAIRDPLSGRSYVYQAMRVTGAGDPFTPLDKTLKGKLPQRKICQEAARGYSSYGNQIGLTTGLVEELYHPGYLAKRMEVGAVVGAAPAENVIRLQPTIDDVILLVGGRTGRDGVGGATGSSKVHDVSSITESSAEVQKGNAPMERKLQRLFRNPAVAKCIKKCNDFGAGGVSVAIGELADSLEIWLDRVPLKYQGLTAKEIALSESQERMALLVSPSNVGFVKNACKKENLEATEVAIVTGSGKLQIFYQDLLIVDLDRDFIDLEGASRFMTARIEPEDLPKVLEEDGNLEDLKDRLQDLNLASQRNLMERFDSSIGRGSVLAPLGGDRQLTPSQGMVALLPSLEGKSKTASIMTYGFNPYLSSESQFLGAYYAVLESLGKFVALGGSLDEVYLSFQEYFEKLGEDSKKWGKPLKSLLGAYKITTDLGIPSIGGKDSMSGSFENLSVPSTLISFACGPVSVDRVISPEFKGKGKIGLLSIDQKEDGTLDLEAWKKNVAILEKAIDEGKIYSLSHLGAMGLVPKLFELAIGNNLGIKVQVPDFYKARYGDFILEYEGDIERVEDLGTIEGKDFVINGKTFKYEDLLPGYLNKLDPIYSPVIEEDLAPIEEKSSMERPKKSKKPVDSPKVIIPVFPGTNCEYDTAAAFKEAGGDPEILVFNNLSPRDVEESIDTLARKIKTAQILALPGGFSMGDEPDGSGKFIANVLRNPKIEAAIDVLLKDQDGLILGICNGFQALIKTGYLPHGKAKLLEEKDPTLHYNNSNRHIARFADTKVATTNSPWTSKLSKDKVYRIPISHGEGRVILSEDLYRDLLTKDQIATHYVKTPNGSFYGIEGLLSPDGKILGKMGHTERVAEDLYKNIPGVDLQEIIASGVEFMRKDHEK